MSAKSGTLKDNLRAIARTIGETFTSPVLSNLYRLAIAEATRFPGIDRTFYETGPQTGEILTTKILQKHITAGELAVTVCPWRRARFRN